jgi:hypothetical protein
VPLPYASAFYGSIGWVLRGVDNEFHGVRTRKLSRLGSAPRLQVSRSCFAFSRYFPSPGFPSGHPQILPKQNTAQQTTLGSRKAGAARPASRTSACPPAHLGVRGRITLRSRGAARHRRVRCGLSARLATDATPVPMRQALVQAKYFANGGTRGRSPRYTLSSFKRFRH